MSVRLRGRYEIGRLVADQGPVRTFEGTDTESERQVLVRMITAATDEDFEALILFQQEGTVVSRLKHPHIWEIYQTFMEDRTCYMILEHVEGQSLSVVLRSERLSLPRVKSIAAQIASALAYAHGRGILHRDLNPDNVLLGPNDQVKLRAMSLLGVARLLRIGAALNTVTNSSIGTPLYMAPEQIEGHPVDGRSDIYSLGALLYALVTGQPPFSGKDAMTIASQHVYTPAIPPRTVNPALPADWDALILKALAKNPVDRFQSAQDMEAAIAQLSVDGPVLLPEPPSAHRAPLGRSCPRCGREGRGKFCGACGTRLSPN